MLTLVLLVGARSNGGRALERVAQFSYERNAPENIEQEQAIEPRNTFIVVTRPFV